LPYVQANQQLLHVRDVSDDAFERLGQAPHERRNRDNLISGREARMLQQVDDLDFVVPG
jgi:hypothetical protein